MKGLKRILQRHCTLLTLLFAQFFLLVYGQGQKFDSLTAGAKGHGVIADAVEERKFTAAVAVLSPDGTVLITFIQIFSYKRTERGRLVTRLRRFS
jgi:hypothetical protein